MKLTRRHLKTTIRRRLGALGGALAQGAPDAQPEAAEESSEPEEPVKSEIRDIYEVFLDSVCLDDRLVEYLIDVVKRHDTDEFAKLSHAAARTLLDMDDFLLWLGNKQWCAPQEEQDCAEIMDACLKWLADEGRGSCWRRCSAAMNRRSAASAAMRRSCEACRRLHSTGTAHTISTATIPVRFLMKFNGVKFPEA